MIRAEGEAVVIKQDGVRIALSLDAHPALPYQFKQAWSAAFKARETRIRTEVYNAEIARWREDHPNAIELRPGVWRDGVEVREGSLSRAPARDEVSPPMSVRVQGGRVGHLWTGGDVLLCGKWVSRSNVTPCDLPLCRACAGKAEK